jgi:DUF4097 and DUF4098 domain-containing protein YvlB
MEKPSMFFARTLGVPGLLLFSTLILAGCQSNLFTATEEVSKTFTVGESVRIVVKSFNGPIHVSTGQEGKVQATVTKRAGGISQAAAEDDLENIEVDLTQEAGVVQVAVRSSDRKPVSSRSATVEVLAPPGAVLELHSRNGGVTSTGPMGDVSVEASNGPIQVKESRGKLNLTTSNGGITVNGGTALDLKTSNGGIDIRGQEVQVKAQTSNGAIHFQGRLANGDHIFQTSNGQIRLLLPEDVPFNVDAETKNGRVTNDFVSSTGRGTKTFKNRFQGSVGKDGLTQIKLRTSNGNIKIQKDKEAFGS